MREGKLAESQAIGRSWSAEPLVTDVSYPHGLCTKAGQLYPNLTQAPLGSQVCVLLLLHIGHPCFLEFTMPKAVLR